MLQRFLSLLFVSTVVSGLPARSGQLQQPPIDRASAGPQVRVRARAECSAGIDDDSTSFEHTPLESLAADGQLAAYTHDGFWQPMDTLRDKNYLEGLWQQGQAPWKVWK